MKKNEMWYAIPRRQSQWALIFIVFRFIKRLIQQIWPLALAFLLRRGNNKIDSFEYAAISLGVISMVSSIIAYYRFFIQIKDNELIIKKGVWRKKIINLPFEKIQSVSFSRNVLHQTLGTTSVSIETAGSDGAEITIDALKMPNAELLRTELYKKIQDAKTEVDAIIAIDRLPENEPSYKTILKHDVNTLWRIGIAANHFRPFGLILSLVGSVFTYSYMLDIDFSDIIKMTETRIHAIQSEYIGYMVIFLPVLGVLYSLIRTFVMYYQFQLQKHRDQYKLSFGLFSREERFATQNKIQVISLSQNKIQKLFKFYKIDLFQANATNSSRRMQKFSIPGVLLPQSMDIISDWLASFAYQEIEGLRVSIEYLYRKLLINGFFSAMALSAVVYYNNWYIWTTIATIAIWISILVWTYLYATTYYYHVHQDYVAISKGVWNRKHVVVPYYKIQDMALQQSPYEWRHKLASLQINTAALSINIPFLSHGIAQNLLDQFTYKLESSNQYWM